MGSSFLRQTNKSCWRDTAIWLLLLMLTTHMFRIFGNELAVGSAQNDSQATVERVGPT